MLHCHYTLKIWFMYNQCIILPASSPVSMSISVTKAIVLRKGQKLAENISKIKYGENVRKKMLHLRENPADRWQLRDDGTIQLVSTSCAIADNNVD